MDVGLFLLHAIVGLFFVGHGAQKLFGVLGGHGIEGTAGFFESLGLKPGRFHAIAAGANELVAGVLLVLGFLLPVAAVLVTATMVGAVLTAHKGKGPWAQEGGWELNVVYVIAAVALAGAGGGAWALDDAIFGSDLAGTGFALGALAVGIVGGAATIAAGRAGAAAPTEEPAESV